MRYCYENLFDFLFLKLRTALYNSCVFRIQAAIVQLSPIEAISVIDCDEKFSKVRWSLTRYEVLENYMRYNSEGPTSQVRCKSYCEEFFPGDMRTSF